MINRIILFALASFNLIASYGQKTINCTINLNHKYQTIDNFGASDCWSVQFVGNWPDSKRDSIADLLFSREMDSKGNPKGIGLSMWRFNIGAGTTEQGEKSGITTDWRRSECVLNPDGTYNWKKQSAQQKFIKDASKRGVENFLVFPNTPPVYFTKNGFGFNKGGGQSLNLREDEYDNFVDYLTNFILGIKKQTGVDISYISPLNEPEWDWDGNTQEGTPAQISEIASVVKKLDHKLTQAGLNTKIIVSESGQLDYMYKSGTNKPGRDNQIYSFFDKNSPNYLGNLKHVPPFMGGHAYWTDYPLSSVISKRKELKAELDKYNLGYWQTEYCIMGRNKEIEGGKKDLTMHTALYVARLMHHDLVIENASAWQWWLGITYSDYKDGLVYVQPNQDKTDGTFTASKLMWAFGNFSRFIRPGSVRVETSSVDNINDPEGLMISSYLNKENNRLITVVINYQTTGKDIRLKLDGARVGSLKPYITSDKENQNLSPAPEIKPGKPIHIPQRSVVTLVGDLEQ